MTEIEGSRRPRRRAVFIVIAAVAVALLLAVPVTRVVLARFGGDDEPAFLTIMNRTDEVVTIYQARIDGQRTEVLVVPAHATGKYLGGCAAALLVAVAPDRQDVATRPASKGCDLTDWIIEGPG